MTVSRTVALTDITPAELAELFCDMDGDQQASFFDAVAEQSANWPGAGFCMQACSIAEHLAPAGRGIIRSLADHAGLIPS